MSEKVIEVQNEFRDHPSEISAAAVLHPRLSRLRLFLITAVLCGVQCSWALQMAFLTPFVQILGIPHGFASLMWLCGPISGFFVQPLIGVLSDGCKNRLGRRRPYLIGGISGVLISQILIITSTDIGRALGDQPSDVTKVHSIVFFVIGFWLLDVCNNVAMGPARALIVDMVAPEQLYMGNAFFSVWMALGNVAGYAIGATREWATWLSFMESPGCSQASCVNLRIAFVFCMIIIAGVLITTCLAAKETPLEDIPPVVLHHTSIEVSQAAGQVMESRLPAPTVLDDEEAIQIQPTEMGLLSSDEREEERRALLNDNNPLAPPNHKKPEETAIEIVREVYEVPAGDAHNAERIAPKDPQREGVMKTIFFGLVRMRGILLRVWFINLLSWTAWWTFLLYHTDWMGRTIFGGDPEGSLLQQDLYDMGVSMGAIGLLIGAVVSWISSLFIAPLTAKLSSKWVWFGSQILFAALLALTWTIQPGQAVAGIAIFSVMGICATASSTIPYALVGMNSKAEHSGRDQGILNMSIVIGQLITSFTVGPWNSIFGTTDVPGFLLGSLIALSAAIMCAALLPRTNLATASVAIAGETTSAPAKRSRFWRMRDRPPRVPQNETQVVL